MRSLAQEGRADEAEDMLYAMIDEGEDPSAAHYGAVMDACASAADYERAERWLFRMQVLEVQPDIATYNALLRVAAAAKNPSEASNIMQDVEEAGLEPTLESFQLVLRAIKNAGEVMSVEPWLEQMYSAGKTPDSTCLGMVIATFAERGLTEKVEEWLAIVERSFPEALDAGAFNSAMSAYAEQGKMAEAARLFQHMEEKGVQPDAASFAILTGDGSEFRAESDVEAWSQRLLDSGVEIDQKAYVAVLGAFASIGEVSKVDEWFERMVREGKQNAEALAVTVETLMLAGGPENEEAAQEWVSQFREAGFAVTPAVYAALSSADVYSGDFEQVEARMQQMEADGLEMDATSLAAILNAYANAEPQQSLLAEQTFKQFMLQGKIKATRPLLEALRASCGGARCLALRRELQLSGPSGAPVSQLPVTQRGREKQFGPGDIRMPGQSEMAPKSEERFVIKSRNVKWKGQAGRRWESLVAHSQHGDSARQLAWE